ncbi:MAG: PQQ-binding-like beta-propeller repeat protein [Deltaproteobacteria bacterium]|nr:PQQ-binding-like beta-propeller repeat protein [Deltaproteobacteria bacterium]
MVAIRFSIAFVGLGLACTTLPPGGGGSGDGGADAGADGGGFVETCDGGGGGNPACQDGGVTDGGTLDGGASDGGIYDGGIYDGGAWDGGVYDGGFDPCGGNDSWLQFMGTAEHRGQRRVVGPQTNIVKWRYYLGTTNSSPWGRAPGSVAIDFDGTLYAAGPQLVALYPDGGVKWVFDAGSAGPSISGMSNRIYVDIDRNVVAAVSKTGTEIWRFVGDGPMNFAPTEAPDGTIYQGGWDGGFVYAIAPDGGLKWRFKTNQKCISYPVTVGFDGTVYVGAGDTNCGDMGGSPNFYAIAPDGGLKWSYDTFNQRSGSPAIGFDGTIYIPSAPHLFALNPNGTLKWKKDGVPTDVSGIITPAVAPDGTLYVGTAHGQVIAVWPDGGTRWTFSIGQDLGMRGFPVVDCRGTVYVGADDRKVYAIAADGGLLWSYTTDAGITEASPAIGADGTLYIASEDGYLYAFGP